MLPHHPLHLHHFLQAYAKALRSRTCALVRREREREPGRRIHSVIRLLVWYYLNLHRSSQGKLNRLRFLPRILWASFDICESSRPFRNGQNEPEMIPVIGTSAPQRLLRRHSSSPNKTSFRKSPQRVATVSLSRLTSRTRPVL